jgi:hypothetical protein
MEMWRPHDIGEVIAERALTFERGDQKRPVKLLIGRPVQEQDAGPDDPWWCPVQIDGLGPNRLHTTVGADSLHALFGALQFLYRMLPYYAQSEEGTIYWLTQEEHPLFSETHELELYARAIDILFKGMREIQGRISKIEYLDPEEKASICERIDDAIKRTRFEEPKN